MKRIKIFPALVVSALVLSSCGMSEGADNVKTSGLTLDEFEEKITKELRAAEYLDFNDIRIEEREDDEDYQVFLIKATLDGTNFMWSGNIFKEKNEVTDFGFVFINPTTLDEDISYKALEIAMLCAGDTLSLIMGMDDGVGFVTDMCTEKIGTYDEEKSLYNAEYEDYSIIFSVSDSMLSMKANFVE